MSVGFQDKITEHLVQIQHQLAMHGNYTTPANHVYEPYDTPARHAQKYYGTSSPCAGTSPMSVVFLLAPVSVTEFERSHSQPSFGSDQL